jgi:hypothetical protein
MIDRLGDRLVHGAVPGLVIFALVVAAVLAGRYGRRGAVLLAVLSVAWLLVNHPMEGETLVPLSHGHGFTAADMAGLAGVLLAAWILLFPRTD